MKSHNTKPPRLFTAHFTSSITDSESWIVADSINNKMSCGGVRIVNDISEREVAALANAMTIKYSFFGRRMGGAKAGIRLPNNISAKLKKRVLEEFGFHFRHLIKSRLYIPWTDLNCGQKDISHIYQGIGIKAPLIPDSSYPTALSVLNSIKAGLAFINCGIKGVKIAIEGYGRVGQKLGMLLVAEGALVVGVSNSMGAIYDRKGLPISKLNNLFYHYGDDFIRQIPNKLWKEKNELLTSKVDVLVPCARSWTITHNNVNDIKANVIVPAANVPYDQAIEDFLWSEGKILIPDFIANSGGITTTILYTNNISHQKVDKIMFKPFQKMIQRLLLKSKHIGIAPSRIATDIAFRRLNKESGLYIEPFLRKIALKIFDSFPILGKIRANLQLIRTSNRLSMLNDMIRRV